MTPRLLSSVLAVLAGTVAPLSAADRPGFNYDESKVLPYTLPNPLVSADGTPVRDAAAWRTQRRPELLEIFSREMFGRTPGGRPAGMHWAVTSVDRAALGGKAVRKEITVWFTEKKDGPQMHLLVYQPPGGAGAHAPWPAFLGLNYFGNNCVNADPGITLTTARVDQRDDFGVVDHHATERTRGVQAQRWNVETVVARGYATATVCYDELCEDRSEGLAKDVAALFGTRATEERKPDEWGALGIWAWGLSRALDVLQSDPEIDGKRVAVHGHSRLGKAALWASAQDERFALVISNDSGCGGAALSKRNFGETVERINASFPFWFARAFRAYNAREDALPFDQHELLALIAPRPLHVASAEGDAWADPRGEFLALKAAEPVYALFGKKGLGVAAWPAVNHPALGDALAYHVRTGKHDITPDDWAQYLDFADRVMR
ncbi:MAG: acetylxylan esterase [Opitutus sp.]|nr:acetylxylan esterase [Opitutus sp.]